MYVGETRDKNGQNIRAYFSTQLFTAKLFRAQWPISLWNWPIESMLFHRLRHSHFGPKFTVFHQAQQVGILFALPKYCGLISSLVYIFPSKNKKYKLWRSIFAISSSMFINNVIFLPRNKAVNNNPYCVKICN